MGDTRRRYEAKFKAKVALEAIKQEKTIAQLSSEYSVHGNQITQWKKRLVQELPGIFTGKQKKAQRKAEDLQGELYRQIGQLKVELDWLKKNTISSVNERRRRIEPEHPDISIARQCELLSLTRSAYYFKPQGVNRYNQTVMRLIDEEYTRHPFYGSRRIAAWLKRQGHDVNRKRVSRLMKEMGIEAVYPKLNLSRQAAKRRKYPYLLRGVVIESPDQVWSSERSCNEIGAIFLVLQYGKTSSGIEL